jgi:hypothetical protein
MCWITQQRTRQQANPYPASCSLASRRSVTRFVPLNKIVGRRSSAFPRDRPGDRTPRVPTRHDARRRSPAIESWTSRSFATRRGDGCRSAQTFARAASRRRWNDLGCQSEGVVSTLMDGGRPASGRRACFIQEEDDVV